MLNLVRNSLAVITLFAAPVLAAEPQGFETIEALGQALFFDTSLSMNRTQSCATCHAPEMAFTDPRFTDAGRAVSLGDDGTSLGDRQAPTLTYAMLTPEFHFDEKAGYRGGQFWDGRAARLEDQAGGPPLNPIEMGMPSKAAVVDRLRENPEYVKAFSDHFGAGVWDDPEAAYEAMTRAIATYERTKEFATFDSKYDRYLRGEAEFTREEELGRLLFFSEQFTNCNQCHQLRTSQMAEDETFTTYEYHNIGVPANTSVRALTGVTAKDMGLVAGGHLTEDIPGFEGTFKTPTLRNVAVTGPYMHNGVFEDLRTVILFYNKYNSNAEARQINPETGAPWRAPEVPQTVAHELLEIGPALEDERIDALVAFLETLTDARYEHLLEE